MDLGFEMAGHTIVWANDVFEDAVQTYRKNFGDHVHLGPIETVSPLPQAEIVIGGFPCQGFSIANMQRHAGDSRNELYMQFLRILEEKRPLYFVAENVKGILSLGRGAVFARIIDDFSSLGYSGRYATLNAADYGVPQRRERVIIVGNLIEAAPAVDFPPAPTHARADLAASGRLLPWETVGAALSGLPEPGTDSKITNHEDFSVYKLRFNGHLGHRLVNPDAPAPTITARGDERGGVVVIHHPNNLRRISPREAATIQSFPLGFEFFGTRTSVYRQVANAVPPLLAAGIARCFPVIVPTKAESQTSEDRQTDRSDGMSQLELTLASN
jgi:DNA (cytosine-5)-methyltransferase 1